MHTLGATDVAGSWWTYVGLFILVAASWAGVPAVGGAALGAAGAAASQGRLNLALVVGVAAVAGEVGGLIGYAIGNRWVALSWSGPASINPVASTSSRMVRGRMPAGADWPCSSRRPSSRARRRCNVRSSSCGTSWRLWALRWLWPRAPTASAASSRATSQYATSPRLLSDSLSPRSSRSSRSATVAAAWRAGGLRVRADPLSAAGQESVRQ